MLNCLALDQLIDQEVRNRDWPAVQALSILKLANAVEDLDTNHLDVTTDGSLDFLDSAMENIATGIENLADAVDRN